MRLEGAHAAIWYTWRRDSKQQSLQLSARELLGTVPWALEFTPPRGSSLVSCLEYLEVYLHRRKGRGISDQFLAGTLLIELSLTSHCLGTHLMSDLGFLSCATNCSLTWYGISRMDNYSTCSQIRWTGVVTNQIGSMPLCPLWLTVTCPFGKMEHSESFMVWSAIWLQNYN